MSKYRSIKTVIDGHTFPSRKEAGMYLELKTLLKAGKIKDLVLQPKFILQSKFTNAEGRKIREIAYVADFSFYDLMQDRWRIIDCKGFLTDVYKVKKKLLDFILKDRGLYLEEEI